MKPITSNNPLLLSHAHLYEALRGLQTQIMSSKRFKKFNIKEDLDVFLAFAEASKALHYADETLKGS
jgi:hypothetical protein